MAEVLTCPQAMKTFPGFSSEALTFLRNLRRNNRRDWFQPRMEHYENLIKAPLLELTCCLSREFARFAPNYVTPPPKSVFRIYRDTRSSQDKTPYKTHIAAVFARQGVDRMRGPCFYFHFTDRELLALGGVYQPERDELPAYRNLIRDHYQEFQKILGDQKARRTVGDLQGEQLSRIPRGFCPGHPAEGLLRHKQWYLVSVMDPKLLTTPRLLPELSRRFQAMAPFVEFLNRPFAQKPKTAGMTFGAVPRICH